MKEGKTPNGQTNNKNRISTALFFEITGLDNSESTKWLLPNRFQASYLHRESLARKVERCERASK